MITERNETAGECDKMDMLKICGLRKRFGDKEVLRGIDLAVPEHSVFGFVGKNGAGKTTTMKAVLGLLSVDGGEIFVAGEKVAHGQTATNRHIGYLPDVPEFYSFMTAREYLGFCGEISGMESALIRSRCDELLSLVGLEKEHHRIKGFSRGMKQRLGIAQALFGRPELLICDEPTSALDPIGRKEILDILTAASRETTVLFSTHILSDVERICTDVAFLNNGVIEISGKLTEVREKYRRDEYFVEMASRESGEALSARFPAMRALGENRFSFNEGEYSSCEVMRHIAECALPIRKIERAEPTLESLFMEVTGK